MDCSNMNEKKLIQDIYRLLDGEVSPGERDDIERYIAEHPEAEKLYRQCEKISRQLEMLPQEEADPYLKSAVMNKINTRQQSQEKKSLGLRFVQDFWHRPAFKLSYIFIAGVVTGFLVLTILKIDFTSSVKKDNLKGTFSSPRSFENLKVAEALQFENSQVKAVCNVRYSQNFVEIHLELTSENMLTSIFEFNTENFSVYNIQPLLVNVQSSSLIASNSVNLNTIGNNKYVIQLYNKKPHSNDIVFRLVQEGQQIYQNTVTINK
ncbi:MAG: anti-sigma factor [Bacteroidales bacterium]